MFFCRMAADLYLFQGVILLLVLVVTSPLSTPTSDNTAAGTDESAVDWGNPLGRSLVFFAGEATDLAGFQCVHGAVRSGNRAATEVLASLACLPNPIYDDIEDVDDDGGDEPLLAPS